jgi:sterol desaturase/sphingolipid hydroxylase (fatty acid hydroxylase superfamily)
MLFFFLGVLAGPPAALLYLLVSPNVGLMFMAVGVSYFLTYEWLHFSYHLPPESWLGRRWLVRKLRGHHALHHDKSMMGRWNFNITFPICDQIFGTYYRAPNARGSQPR